MLKLEIFNEITTITLVDMLSSFSDANTHEAHTSMDALLMLTVVSNLMVHIYFLVAAQCESCKKKRKQGKKSAGCMQRCLRKKES